MPILSRTRTRRRQIDTLHQRIGELLLELDESRIDPVTKLPARQYWTRLAADEFEHARTTAVLLVDLDRFKHVNDTFGHAAGDAVLATAAVRLRHALPRAVVGRLGGDEFAIVTRLPVWRGDLDRMVDELTAPVPYAGGQLRVGVSIGLAYRADLPPHWPLRYVLAAADVAMYEAKRTGGRGYSVYQPETHGEPVVYDNPTSRTRHRDRS